MRGRRVRLFLRLTADVNDRLRALMRYHGELSRYIDDALTSLDLSSIELIPVIVGRRARNHGDRVRLGQHPSSRSGQTTRLQRDRPGE